MWVLCTLGYGLPTLLLVGVVVRSTWSRADWWLLDLIAVTLPGMLWCMLVWEDNRDRSLGNFIVELPLLAVIVSALAVLRAKRALGTSRLIESLFFLVAASLTAVTFARLFPGLQE